MNWDYNAYLVDKLNTINLDEELGLKINVVNEEVFVKPTYFDADSIFVIIKKLSSSYMFSAETTPIQVLVLSEENSQERVQNLINKFTSTYNWVLVKDGTINVKQEYNSPVVLSNFEEMGAGYRSMLYFTGTLYIIDNMQDITDLEIDGASIEPISFSMSYAMQGNTQPVGNNLISTTAKSTSTTSISITLPFKDYQSSSHISFTDKVKNIAKGSTSGNSKFSVSFKIGGIQYYSNVDMVLIACDMSTAQNQISGLQLVFMR